MAWELVFQPEAFRAIMRSPETQELLQAKVEAIAAVANLDADDHFDPRVTVGAERAHGRVWTNSPEAMYLEATDRTLTRAIDAGRG